MDKLNRLPEVSEDLLSGLKADDALKQKILLSAANPAPARNPRYRTAIALCCLSFLLILLCVFVSRLPAAGNTSDLQVISAGSHRESSPVNLDTVLENASEPIESEAVAP